MVTFTLHIPPMLAYIPYISIHGSYGVYFRNLKDLIPSSEWRFSVWSFAPPACSSAVLFSCLLHPPKKGLSLGDTVSISFHQFPSVSHNTNHCVKTHDTWDIVEYSKRPSSWLPSIHCSSSNLKPCSFTKPQVIYVDSFGNTRWYIGNTSFW